MSILENILTSGPGRLMTKQFGLKDPPKLRRGTTMPAGEILVHATGSSTLAADTLTLLGLSSGTPLLDAPGTRTRDEKGEEQPPKYSERPGALIIDAADLTRLDDLEKVRQVLRPAMKALEKSGRVIFLGPRPEDAAPEDHEARAAAEALEGVMRTIGKELRDGATANLIRVTPGTQAADLTSTLSFLIEGRSAFVSGQAWGVGTSTYENPVTAQRFTGRIVVVTGAARGIGADIARTLAGTGATVVAVDVPAAGAGLAEIAVEIGGSALQLDITDPAAAEKIAAHIATVYGHGAELYAIVHNAGITRDKLAANLDEERWAQVIDVNLRAEMTINATLLDTDMPGSFGSEGRIVGIASTSGIAGQKGQANYAASKAGVIGYTDSLSAALEGTGITANAVAPGFIETEMTAAIPYVNREVYRRVNSLSQGGRPVDVAETIAYLCSPASAGVNGQTIRVCGQNLVGK